MMPASVNGAQRAASVGPNNVTSGVPIAPSRWPMPLSFATAAESR